MVAVVLSYNTKSNLISSQIPTIVSMILKLNDPPATSQDAQDNIKTKEILYLKLINPKKHKQNNGCDRDKLF